MFKMAPTESMESFTTPAGVSGRDQVEPALITDGVMGEDIEYHNFLNTCVLRSQSLELDIEIGNDKYFTFKT